MQTVFLDLVASHLALCRYKVLIHDTIQPRAVLAIFEPAFHPVLPSGSTEVLKDVGRAKMQNSRALLPIKFISVTEDVSRVVVVIYCVMKQHHFFFMA